MIPNIESVKGVHPGLILERILNKSNQKKSAFALKIGEYPGIISEICRTKRGVSAAMSLKLENELDIEEGYFMVLQAYYEVRMARQKNLAKAPKPNMQVLRRNLFWDIDLNKLDFNLRKKFVIKRVFERGNDQEIKEIINFYGIEVCKNIIKSARNLLYSGVNNAKRHLNLERKDLECCQKSTQKPHQRPYY